MNSNSKLFGLFALSLLVLAMVASSVSALSLNAGSLNFDGIGSSKILSLSNPDHDTSFNVSIGSTISSLVDDLGSPYNFDVSAIQTDKISSTGSATFNISTKADLGSGSFTYGKTYQQIIQFDAVNSSDSSIKNSTNVTLNYIKSFCSNGNQNDSDLALNVQVTNNGNGDSDTQWLPLDNVEVQVELDNNKNIDLNNVYFEIGLYKEGSTKNVASDFIWLSDSEKVQIGDISSGDSDKYTFNFKVNPNIKTGSYKLFVKAYSKDDGENKLCIDHSTDLNDYGSSDYYGEIQVSSPTSSKSVIVDTSSLPTVTTAQCRQQVTLSPMVYNIGSKDYKDQIMVRLYSTDLGLNLNQTVYGNINSGDGVQVPFSFTIPQNATEKTYSLYFTTYYDYNQGKGAYYNNYRYGSSDTFNTLLTVSGNCVYATPATTQVQAQLESGGKAGNPLVIKATVTNTGSKVVSYNFGLEGYSSWATLSSISPSNITLAPGQSQEITLNMNVNTDASGDKQFYLDTYSNGYLITQQPLSLSVTPSFSLSSITGGVINGGNAGLWIFNIVLVLAIIIVLVIVIARRRK